MFKGTMRIDKEMYRVKVMSYGRPLVKDIVFCDKNIYRTHDPRMIVDCECDCYEKIIDNPESKWYAHIRCKHLGETEDRKDIPSWRTCEHPRARELASEQDCEIELAKKLENL